MADAYVKTYQIDETFTMEDTNDGPDLMAFRLHPDAPDDMYLWSGYFIAAEFGHTPGVYAWVNPTSMDAEGDPIENSYANAGMLFVITNFSTYLDPTVVRLLGEVKVMYLPVTPPVAP